MLKVAANSKRKIEQERLKTTSAGKFYLEIIQFIQEAADAYSMNGSNRFQCNLIPIVFLSCVNSHIKYLVDYAESISALDNALFILDRSNLSKVYSNPAR